MPLDLNAVVVRHERRIRALFSNAVALGAFSAARYRIVDGSGTPSTSVSGALVVPGAPACVELALGADLAADALYTLSLDAVPGLDGSVTPPGTAASFRWSSGEAVPNAEQASDDLGGLLYGVDLVWTGADFTETPLGDLQTVQGAPNAKSALERRLSAEEDLPWKPGRYGAAARDAVDGPQTDATTLRGAILRQARADDRVKRVTATLRFDEAGGGDAFFDVTVTLIGAEDFALTLPITRS